MKGTRGVRPPVIISSALTLVALIACARAPEPAKPALPAATVPIPTVAAPPASAGLRAFADVQGAFGTGAPVVVTLHLVGPDYAPLPADRLQRVHTEQLHVLAVDPSLADYSHLHPVPQPDAGDWRFDFRPRFDRPYRLWLDITPVGGKQQYLMVTLNEKAPGAPVAASTNLEASSGDVSGRLSFDAPLVAGRNARGRVELSRGGKPLTALQPVMGAYGHIVGIGGDWRSIAHVHPMGAAPRSAEDRGGPVLEFHLEPATPGFLKLFVQVRVDDADVYLPFGLEVASGPGA